MHLTGTRSTTVSDAAHPAIASRGSLAGLLLIGAHLAVAVQLIAVAAHSDVSDVGRLAGVALAIGLVLVALAASRGGGRAIRGLGALVLGLVATSAGIGIAPVWLAVTGVSAGAVVAIAGLVAGIGLTIHGGLQLIRATPGWWRLLAIPVAFLLVQFVLMPGSAAVFGTHPPVTPLSADRPSGALDVSFATSDGASLGAWYTSGTRNVTVVVLPGSGGERGSTSAHAAVLARHGYGVLALDSRGTGGSGGIGNAWGWHGEADIRAAVDWLLARARGGTQQVALLGLSMGGEEAITAAAADPRIGAVVAEGASARTPGDLAYLPTDPVGSTHRIVSTIMWSIADLMTDAAAPAPLVELMPAVGSRLLLIVGNDPAEVAAAPLFAVAAPDIEVWSLPDTPHMGALGTHPDEWEARVIDFLDARLPG
jgi:dienelactone hydrolase